jgi:hypothetical protein
MPLPGVDGGLVLDPEADRVEPGQPGDVRALPQCQRGTPQPGCRIGDAADHPVLVRELEAGVRSKTFSYHSRLLARSPTGSLIPKIPSSSAFIESSDAIELKQLQ